MHIVNDIIYGSCCAILILYMITTVLVFIQRGCTSYAASFLFACALWVNLTLFNFSFLLPSLIRHVSEIEAPTARWDEPFGLAAGRATLRFVTSPAMKDLAFMLVGWLSSAMSISNSLEIWQEMEQYLDATEPNDHGIVVKQILCLARRVEGYVGVEQPIEPELPGIPNHATKSTQASALFAFPRWFHRYFIKLLSSNLPNEDSHDIPEKKGGNDKIEVAVY